MMNNKNPEDHAPQGGEWKTFPSGSIGVNNSFGGHEGNFTTTPSWVIEQEVKVYVVGDRVTHIQLENGWVFRHENAMGANIHGGNQTTSEWFTFGIGQFRLVGADGLIHHNSPRLTDKDGFQGANTITPCKPLPAPCFAEGTMVLTKVDGDNVETFRRIEELKVGDRVYVEGGLWIPILWVGGQQVKVTKKNRPVNIGVDQHYPTIVSPQHRVLTQRKGGEKVWVSAKLMAEETSSAEYVDPMPDSIWYGHILLSGHFPVGTYLNLWTESLKVTDRSLSGMSQEMVAEIMSAMEGKGLTKSDYETKVQDLTRVEIKRMFQNAE